MYIKENAQYNKNSNVRLKNAPEMFDAGRAIYNKTT